MDQESNTCPSCGAPTPSHFPCPYCGWEFEQPTPSEELPLPVDEAETGDQITEPAHLRDLMGQEGEPEHLLDQVPEEMRGVLAARLKAAEEAEHPTFSEHTESTLREQGYVISEDAHGARLAGAPSQVSDLSASDVVKMAAELDGGVQPQVKLPICEKCEAASPVGSENCQWCGEPFS